MSRTSRIANGRSWQSFVFEVAVIITGVLIALGAESLISNWRWQSTIEETRANLDSEASVYLVNAMELLSVDRCRARWLDDARTALENAKTGPWVPPRPVRGPVTGQRNFFEFPAYGGPSRSYVTSAWDEATNSGVLIRLPDEDVQQYSLIFTSSKRMYEAQTEEQQLTAITDYYAGQDTLSAAERAELGVAIERLDFLRKLRSLIMAQNLDSSRGMLTTSDTEEEIDEARRDILERLRSVYGECVVDYTLHLEAVYDAMDEDEYPPSIVDLHFGVAEEREQIGSGD